MAFCTAMLWGAVAPVVKIIAAGGISLITVMCYRAVFVVMVMGFWLYFRKGAGVFNISLQMTAMYVVIGILTIVFNATGYLMSCTYLSVPQALILHYTYPLVTMAGSVFITKEKPSFIQVISGFLVILGLYVGFSYGSGGGKAVSATGLIWGVISVIGFSSQTLLSRRMLRSGESDPLVQLFFIHLFGGAVLIAGKSFISGWSDLSLMTPALFMIIQYPAVAAGLLGFGFLFSALKYIPASQVSLVCTLEIVFALLLTPFLLHQTPNVYELTGCAIILTAVACSLLAVKKDS